MEPLDQINKKMDIIIKLLVNRSIEGKNFDEKITVLTNLGFDNLTISELMGAKSSTIRTRKSQLKAKKTKK